MRRILLFALLCQTAILGQQSATSEPTMFVLPLPTRQTKPMQIPTSTEDATLIELPYAIEAWSGRGFSIQGAASAPDGANANPTVVAGDFMLWPADMRGYKRFTVTPLVEGASRIIHVFLEGERTLTLEIFATREREQAFKRVTFIDAERSQAAAEKAAEQERAKRTNVTRSDTPPESRYANPTAETQRGLIQFMRGIQNMPADMAGRMVAANPYLHLAKHDREISSGDYSIALRFTIRDSITDTLGICVALKNNTSRRLVFDPKSWIIRAGNQIIPVSTTDFAGVLEPNASQAVFLVVTRGVDGRPTRLLPENELAVSVTMTGSASARPVELIDVNVEPTKR